MSCEIADSHYNAKETAQDFNKGHIDSYFYNIFKWHTGVGLYGTVIFPDIAYWPAVRSRCRKNLSHGFDFDKSTISTQIIRLQSARKIAPSICNRDNLGASHFAGGSSCRFHYGEARYVAQPWNEHSFRHLCDCGLAFLRYWSAPSTVSTKSTCSVSAGGWSIDLDIDTISTSTFVDLCLRVR